MIIIEQIYLWLSIIDGLHYYIFVRLLKAFNSISNIYNSSKEVSIFSQILSQNNIIIEKSLLNQLTSNKIKIKAWNLYFEMKTNNIKFIPIYSKNYPADFLNMYNPSYVLCYYGDISLLSKNNKIYTYHAQYFTKYGLILYNDFVKHIGNEGVNVYLNEFDVARSICIVSYSQYLSNLDTLDISNLYIIHLVKTQEIELLPAIADKLLIIQAMYEKDIALITDIMLEMGKEIMVLPGNIYTKTSYFSNYLIKDGATLILNKYQVIK